MSKMIERVAAAICSEDTPGHPWEEIDPVWQEMNRRRARAGIEAMRIKEVIYWVDGRPNASPQDIAWNERIDEALK